ncbi:MAG: selenium cofactor biosynthesis protein YqeC [Clostridia bacterium]|nr:selenium cofactor biosynthesis protein YqeC [Clostridia bacterium]
MLLSRLLEIEKGVTAVIGSGGKTTLIETLARENQASKRVIITTTTHIRPPEGVPLLENARPFSDSLVCMGRKNEEGKLCCVPEGVEAMLPLADYIFVEADGSRRLPIKAHAAHEPCIPACANKTVLVVGASGFMRPIFEVVHRKEIFCALTGLKESDLVTPEALAAIICKEALSDLVFINQVEDDASLDFSKRLKRLLPLPVYAGALMKEEWQCLS